MAGVSPASKRSNAYDEKVVPTTISLKLAARLPDMSSRYSAAVVALAQIEQQIQSLLNGVAEGVETIQYPFYLNFGREIWKRQRAGIAGAALTEQAQQLHDKYVGYGLATANLVSIALDVFDITVVAPE